MPARIVTLGDLQAALGEAPYDTMLEVTMRPEVDGVRRVDGTMSSVVPEKDDLGNRLDPSGKFANPKLVETAGRAETVEDLVNKLVEDHAGNLIARLGSDYPGHAHYGHDGSRTWWTECQGCAACQPVRR